MSKAQTPAEEDAAYEAAVKDLNGLQTNYQIIEQIKASGGRINANSIPEFAAFVEKLGHTVESLDGLNVIHVAGTKGKGSTCAFVQAMLQRMGGLRVGLFTSPHLIEVRERIQINGAALSRGAFARYFYEVYDGLRAASPALRRVAPESPDMPMYFRFLTLMAFHVFLRERVDVAVVEVGVGGAYDSTNVIRRPAVCGIASLGLDHQAALGATLEEIAWHKAGIIKDAVPVFTVAQPPAAMRVVAERAAAHGAPLAVAAPVGDDVALGIAGTHQRANAGLALALVRAWVAQHRPACSDGPWALQGLREARWPGRTQSFASPRRADVAWHVDGAHTAESMAACGAWFAGVAEADPRACVLLFNAAHSRSADALLQALAHSTQACRWVAAVFCPNVSARADSANATVAPPDAALAAQHAAARAWAALAPGAALTVLPSIDAAVAHVEAAAYAAPVHVLATGSLHLVGGVLDAAKGSL
ncbi:Folylpolyglutamate synthetase [Coemansia thaxteri]|uniref:Folylpolyglutamate synthase n=1 Tax=Coemansia thaxteri TaxID=2663907 RepID=A0A9W8BKC7_9FUNG|nr:Folylpolyglutamate synthetase [Coemansia thaxteri]KAJ2005068.1 Folylpolyglutamate synthetase [Coemansia thaxteri]KAJ2482953.1 Folylpolyglutamate synthetase [Coemansia sp. RSA 2320]